MQVREQVRIRHVVPVELWRDAIARDGLWLVVRQRASEAAAGRPGWTLTDDPGTRTIVYTRIVETADGEHIDVECAEAEAELVNLLLSCWAAKTA